jgi:hypothetical protein
MSKKQSRKQAEQRGVRGFYRPFYLELETVELRAALDAWPPATTPDARAKRIARLRERVSAALPAGGTAETRGALDELCKLAAWGKP